MVCHIEDLVQNAAEDVDVWTPDRRFYIFVAYDDHGVVVTIEDILSAVETISDTKKGILKEMDAQDWPSRNCQDHVTHNKKQSKCITGHRKLQETPIL